MRIDKYLADATEFSRKQIHQKLRKGLVTVNGKVLNKAASQVNSDDQICLDGNTVEARRDRYIMLYKPQGYVCANKDSEHPVVLDLIERSAQLQICGRLDIDTTGLVLLSDDGQWNHRLTSPKHGCLKRYYVHLARELNDEAKAQLEQGVLLNNEPKPCKPAHIDKLYSNECIITIGEGRYHQVKRMFAAVGNHVEELHRLSIGSIELDPDLAPGEYRDLRRDEIESI